MNNITAYLYMKVFQNIENTNYEFHHVLFHLYRYLSINNLIYWERLFSFRNNIFKDDDFEKNFRLLLHHHFVDLKTKNITNEGLNWIRKKDEELLDIKKYLNDFFSIYKGEYSFENSCFENISNFTFGCHLCKHRKCLSRTNFFQDLFSSTLFQKKNPYKSFSQKTAIE